MKKTKNSFRIYINNTLLVLTKTKNLKKWQSVINPDLIVNYKNKQKYLLSYIDKFEKSKNKQSCIIHSDEYKLLLSHFLNLYFIIEAGGGLVTNEKRQILFIYRKGMWDLPKGKIELNETKKEGALREVIEETGIGKLQLKKKIGVTHHSFKYKGSRNIKKTHWYHMTSLKQTLTPQKNEGITMAKWMSIEKFTRLKEATYNSVWDVLNTYKSQTTSKNPQ